MMIIKTNKLNLWYGAFQALIDVDLAIERNRITALIGPSGCGKSTLLRVFNRMNDLIEGVRMSGSVNFEGKEILDHEIDLITLRKRIGMVFQRPNPFPLSVFENVVYGLRVHGEKNKQVLAEAAEKSLSAVLLFDELKDKLSMNALGLSLEQQQRLCIARLLSVTPEVLLMDEPCSALDPFATMKIEELMIELKKQYTIVIVTHNMQQAARISDDCGYLLLGELVEFADTKKIFTTPADKRTEDYITGRFG
ncbi:phosphate ABC transporter ATP-binding protein [candidate division WOR-1 bacterium RIFCSPHIGHO2_01_FULL_53_15]|uniref:Phosphate ABC transporter ATP-binding protein n=1 Tax=candidate division WOR-1 bacterium RIFCSPHIGHO2_01_FULL_53_15 TaxID=1802564 RepID=A0A1F4Q1A8_UNCSA|nr:MAG: phosphate ABC transporter ATP-binding protein [candidate division WOR-1 bacterium RIFCSPHIGHO2_01_FULL_53_15]OGC13060.1 MAG: phosphate ABC transporter ATP-binding protein [candidate division WOR-1 bacterium RIFCSPHIGHO2_02_FULL_53_26]